MQWELGIWIIILGVAVFLVIFFLIWWQTSDGRGTGLRKVLTGNIEIRDVIIFFSSLLLGFLLIWFAFEIILGMNLAFDGTAPTYNDIALGMGAKNIFDKIVSVLYMQWTSLITAVTNPIFQYLIISMILQWVLIWLILGIFIALSSLGHKNRFSYNMLFIMVIAILMMIWLNTNVIVLPDVKSMATVMALINILGVTGFGLLFNKIFRATIFKGIREWEMTDNA